MPRTVCPQCGSSRVARKHYQGLGVFKPINPYRPYTCRDCHHDFSALWRGSSVVRTLENVIHRTGLLWTAACPRCLSADVRRTNARGVQGGWGAKIARLSFIPAYRCNACRNQYFALRRQVPAKSS